MLHARSEYAKVVRVVTFSKRGYVMNALVLEQAKTELQRQLEADIEGFELDIDQAEVSVGEEWFRIATNLKGIKERYVKAKKRKVKLWGCKNFEEYCKSPRSRCGKAYAYRMLAALEIRRRIPSPTGDGIGWSEWSIRPLTELLTNQSQIAAARTAIANAAKHGTPLGTACREAVDKAKDTGAYKKAKAKQEEEKAAKRSPAANLKTLLSYTRKHYDLLSEQDESFWTAAEKEEPGIVALVAEALEQLAAYLRA